MVCKLIYISKEVVPTGPRCFFCWSIKGKNYSGSHFAKGHREHRSKNCKRRNYCAHQSVKKTQKWKTKQKNIELKLNFVFRFFFYFNATPMPSSSMPLRWNIVVPVGTTLGKNSSFILLQHIFVLGSCYLEGYHNRTFAWLWR